MRAKENSGQERINYCGLDIDFSQGTSVAKFLKGNPIAIFITLMDFFLQKVDHLQQTVVHKAPCFHLSLTQAVLQASQTISTCSPLPSWYTGAFCREQKKPAPATGPMPWRWPLHTPEESYIWTMAGQRLEVWISQIPSQLCLYFCA